MNAACARRTGDDPGAADRGEWLLRLYVAGMTPTAERALRNLRSICREHLGPEVPLEVVDLHERPEVAAEEKIFAVPTTVRHRPGPVRKVVGDLSDRKKTLAGLGIPTGS